MTSPDEISYGAALVSNFPHHHKWRFLSYEFQPSGTVINADALPDYFTRLYVKAGNFRSVG